MSYQSQTATTFVKLNLTDLGRQKMALGKFSIDQVVFSDREVNYEFNRRYPIGDVDFANMNPTSDRLYDVENNKILSPAFAAAGLPSNNFDGTKAYQVSDNVTTSTQILTARTESRGLWSAVTSGSNQAIGNYIVDSNKYIAAGQMLSQNIDGTSLIPTGGFFSSPPDSTELLYFRFTPPTTVSPSIDSTAPMYSQWYRMYGKFNNSVHVDRNVPDFNGVSAANNNWYEYPLSATTSYWNSGTTSPGEVWSLNIVRTSNVLGTNTTMAQNGSGYTSYGSIKFAGIKRYFGFDKTQRAVGFVWHQDKFTGNTYGDMFMPKTTQMDLPDLMWHRKSGSLPGQNITSGHRFVDAGSGLFYDEIAKTNYTQLKDGTDMNAVVVGRVYYDLKLIVITDQELLTAMSYKSNRNYTLPKLNVELSESHPDDGAIPWVQEGYTYYFSYYTRDDGAYVAGDSYGFKDSSPCEYWTEVVGRNRPDGSHYYASVSLNPTEFPYLRDETTMESLSGTGWVSNQVQLVVNALKTSETGATGADRVRSQEWSAVTVGDNGINQNGVYVGEASHDNVYPQFLGTRVFNINQDNVINAGNKDWESNVQKYYLSSNQQSRWNYSGDTGMTFGHEVFLNGNVTTTFGLRTEKIVATVSVGKNELNASLNGGFDGNIDTSAYITEIGILNDRNELMAVGKPTYPIRKNIARHLLFQLEIDI